jgi:hypothetical protein
VNVLFLAAGNSYSLADGTALATGNSTGRMHGPCHARTVYFWRAPDPTRWWLARLLQMATRVTTPGRRNNISKQQQQQQQQQQHFKGTLNIVYLKR